MTYEKKIIRNRIVAAASAYLLIGLLTYGWTFHRGCVPSPSRVVIPSGIEHVCAGVLGIGWPIYWTLKAARDGLAP